MSITPPPPAAATLDRSGTLAARPAATTVPAGTRYFATDDNGGTVYRSNGTAWTQVAAAVTASSGAVLARASATAQQTGITSATDITGLSITFTVTNKPVTVRAEVPYAFNDTALGQVQLQITDAANTITAVDLQKCATASDPIHLVAEEEITAPGTYTRKVRIARATASGTITALLNGSITTARIKATEG